MEYEVCVAEEGTYTFTVYAAMAWESGTSATIAILKDDTEVLRGQVNPSENWNIFRPNVIGRLQLNQGINKIKVKNLSGGFHFDYFTLELN